MKMLFLIVIAAATISGLPAFGQGYFAFTGPVRDNWDYWSIPGVARTSTNNRLAFLWGTGTPLVDSVLTSTPTNYGAFYNWVAAWTAILTDPNFHLALNNADGSLATVQSAANGAWQYGLGSPFPVQDTSPGIYQVFVIGWGGGFVSPTFATGGGDSAQVVDKSDSAPKGLHQNQSCASWPLAVIRGGDWGGNSHPSCASKSF